MKKVDLLIIDPQNDFCVPIGALFVQGADEDMKRLSALVYRLADKLNDIHVTLDSHHLVDIAHPIYWKGTDGVSPPPFTIISVEDQENGTWTPRRASLSKRSLEYSKALEKNQRYPLCIWPPHCLIGSWGHNVVPCLFEALKVFEEQFAIVDYVTKGSNLYTEHYSAVMADVPDPDDPGTQINTRFINTLLDADIIAVAGEAGSHCLANTVRDIADNFGDDKYIQKLVLLEDATSPVTSFEGLQTDFIKEMTARGMQIASTVDFLSAVAV